MECKNLNKRYFQLEKYWPSNHLKSKLYKTFIYIYIYIYLKIILKFYFKLINNYNYNGYLIANFTN